MRNDYEIRGDVTAISLVRKKEIIAETLISTSKLKTLEESGVKRWNAKWSRETKSFYVQGTLRINDKFKTIMLHRVILDAPKGLEIDHINRDTLNNIDDNLRIVTRAENQQNKGLSRNNTSGHKNVVWNKRTRKWGACFYKHGKRQHLGWFDDKEEAIRAIQNTRKEHMNDTTLN